MWMICPSQRLPKASLAPSWAKKACPILDNAANGSIASPSMHRAFVRDLSFSGFIAGEKVEGAVTVEAVDLRDLTDFGSTLDLARPEALSAVADFAESLMSAFSADDLVRSVAAARAGNLGRPLSGIEQAAVRFEASRSLADVADLLSAINRAGGVRCYRPAVLAAAQRALQLAISPAGPTFREATVTIREYSRLIGRPLAKRSVGSTLLPKGLEADISVVLNAGALDARSLYVAMTRGSRRVLVCSPSPILNPRW